MGLSFLHGDWFLCLVCALLYVGVIDFVLTLLDQFHTLVAVGTWVGIS